MGQDPADNRHQIGIAKERTGPRSQSFDGYPDNPFWRSRGVTFRVSPGHSVSARNSPRHGL